VIQRDLPGADVLEVGLSALEQNGYTPEALAVWALHGRLRNCGVDVPDMTLVGDAEIRMYEALGRRGEGNPHAAMNGLMRRLDAYASAAEARRHRGPQDK
jgi:hypothetical protein